MLQAILLEIIIEFKSRVQFPQIFKCRDAARVVGCERGPAEALAKDGVAETGGGGVEGCVEYSALGLEEGEEAGARDGHGGWWFVVDDCGTLVADGKRCSWIEFAVGDVGLGLGSESFPQWEEDIKHAHHQDLQSSDFQRQTYTLGLKKFASIAGFKKIVSLIIASSEHDPPMPIPPQHHPISQEQSFDSRQNITCRK